VTRRRVAVRCLLALVLVSAACGEPPAPTIGTVASIDVRGVVRPDGSVDVRERIEVAPSSNAVRFTRTVRTPYGDDVAFTSATVDGQPLEAGAAGFSVAEPGEALRTMWQREQVVAPIVLELNYTIASAVGVREPRGRLEWPVLAAARDFAADQVTISLDVPQGSHIYDGTGMAEAGWLVEVAGGRITARRAGVAAAEAATLLAVFDVDRSRVRQGAWEWNLDRREQYRFALIAAGLFILVVGAGILGQLRLQYPPLRAGASAEAHDASRADRRMLSRGLRVSAAVGLVVAACAAGAAHRWLPGLGMELQAIPGSMALVSLAFAVAGWWYGRHAAGAERRHHA
jgi:hypothetical protein